MNRVLLTAVCILAFASCTHEADQEVHPSPKQGSPVTSAALASQDREFLEKAARGNNAEIAIGGLPNGRSSNGEVIQFGRMMVSEHRALNAQLAAICLRKHIILPESLGESQQDYDELIDRRLHEFDSEFARVMIFEHQNAADLYKQAASGVVDPELRAFAASNLPRIDAHLAHAKGMSSLAAKPPEPAQ